MRTAVNTYVERDFLANFDEVVYVEGRTDSRISSASLGLGSRVVDGEFNGGDDIEYTVEGREEDGSWEETDVFRVIATRRVYRTRSLL